MESIYLLLDVTRPGTTVIYERIIGALPHRSNFTPLYSLDDTKAIVQIKPTYGTHKLLDVVDGGRFPLARSLTHAEVLAYLNANISEWEADEIGR